MTDSNVHIPRKWLPDAGIIQRTWLWTRTPRRMKTGPKWSDSVKNLSNSFDGFSERRLQVSGAVRKPEFWGKKQNNFRLPIKRWQSSECQVAKQWGNALKIKDCQWKSPACIGRVLNGNSWNSCDNSQGIFANTQSCIQDGHKGECK